ncbi:MAG: hypothetical protein LBQ46_11815 [Treponema sp.]|nr:hypothetical protein [Treponema sp.]
MKADNPIRNFTLNKEEARFIGEDLQKPECILAEKDGSVWAADARGGVCHIKSDGSQEIITQKYAEKIDHNSSNVDRFFKGTLPNGLAFASNGDILISKDGKEIGKVNFVLRDSADRLWITITTMKKNWLDALRPERGCFRDE